MFPRAQLGAMRLTDGGLVANDPTMVAIQEAAALWPGRPLGLVLRGAGLSMLTMAILWLYYGYTY